MIYIGIWLDKKSLVLHIFEKGVFIHTLTSPIVFQWNPLFHVVG